MTLIKENSVYLCASNKDTNSDSYVVIEIHVYLFALIQTILYITQSVSEVIGRYNMLI